jgi:hypothetical protein
VVGQVGWVATRWWDRWDWPRLRGGWGKWGLVGNNTVAGQWGLVGHVVAEQVGRLATHGARAGGLIGNTAREPVELVSHTAAGRGDWRLGWYRCG